jgi:hypothetical protein
MTQIGLRKRAEGNKALAACLLFSILLLSVFGLGAENHPDSGFVVIRLDEMVVSRNINTRSLTARIGESFSGDFHPRLELSAWGGECAFEIDLRADGAVRISEMISEFNDGSPRISWREDEASTVSFYKRRDGNLEWEIVLGKKPAGNVFTYPIQTRGLRFYFQDTALVPDHIDYYMPDSAVYSYAVYHESKRDNRIILNGSDTTYKAYLAGKAFHIYRPRAHDQHGDTVWCEIRIDTVARALVLTVPPDFLDDARYPVTIDPSIGYTTLGSADLAFDDYDHYCNWEIEDQPDGNGALCTAYIGARASGSGGKARLSVWIKGSDCAGTSHHATSDEITIDNNLTAAWYSASISGSLNSTNKYITSYAGLSGGAVVRLRYDVGSSGDSKDVSDDDWTAPGTLSGCSNDLMNVSAYCEYTMSGGDEMNARRRRIQQEGIR